MRVSLLRTLLNWGGWIPAVIWYKSNGFVLKVVTGRSMQPTLNPDTSAWRDIGVFDRSVLLRKYKFKKGDIIAIRSPLDPNTLLVKRIIAVENDRIQTLPPCPHKQITVPEGHIWVEGDESFHSDDSNLFGAVPLGLVDSRLLFLIWPFGRFGRPPVPRREREEWRRGRVESLKISEIG